MQNFDPKIKTMVVPFYGSNYSKVIINSIIERKKQRAKVELEVFLNHSVSFWQSWESALCFLYFVLQ
jgi:hypothetical protein